MPSLDQLWTTLLAIILILAIILVSMAGLIFIFAVIVGYRKETAKDRQPQQDTGPADPPFSTQNRVLHGPQPGDFDTTPKEFCPICHYHWTACANIHVMHGEPIPASVTKGTARSVTP